MTARHIRQIFEHPERHDLFHRRVSPGREIVGARGHSGTKRVGKLGNIDADQIATEDHTNPFRVDRLRRAIGTG